MEFEVEVREEAVERYEPPCVVELGTIPELTKAGVVDRGHGHIAGGS
jgi:hypothetical protein